MAKIQRKIVYPHRTTLIDDQVCDVCDEQGVHFTGVALRPYIGLWACNGESCMEKVMSWLEANTMSNEALLQELGDLVYVQRSGGRKESGWSIRGDAYRENVDGPFWVLVRDNKRRRSKCVTLDKLRSWNT
jgi:hypothetical protein